MTLLFSGLAIGLSIMSIHAHGSGHSKLGFSQNIAAALCCVAAFF